MLNRLPILWRIFYAKCGSKDTSTNIGVILCDGICEHAYPWKCLVSPLLNEESNVQTSYDLKLMITEHNLSLCYSRLLLCSSSWGWALVCPECKCDIYCIDLLNDIHATHLSIQDKSEVSCEAFSLSQVGYTDVLSWEELHNPLPGICIPSSTLYMLQVHPTICSSKL